MSRLVRTERRPPDAADASRLRQASPLWRLCRSCNGRVRGMGCVRWCAILLGLAEPNGITGSSLRRTSRLSSAICILPTTTGRPLTQDEDSVFEIEIPASGRVNVQPNSLFSIWHRESAVYSNGEQLQIGVRSPENDTTSVAYWSLNTDDKDRIWKFVGNRSEMLEALDVVHLTPGTNWKPPAKEGEAIARPLDD